MIRNTLFASVAILLFGGATQAATTLQFSVSPNGATNFANASGTVTNGMLWGVVIDSNGNGFSGSGAGFYDAFNPGVSGFLSSGGSLTDDYYFATGVSTSTLGAPFFSGSEAGSGAITTANNVPSTGDGVSGVNAADPFALIWFATSTAANGDKYGMFTTGAFSLPASGIVNFSSTFAGADPVRSASNSIGGAGPVPEPSRLMLLGLGAMGLVFRRRRE